MLWFIVLFIFSFFLYENSNNKDKLAYIKRINETFQLWTRAERLGCQGGDVKYIFNFGLDEPLPHWEMELVKTSGTSPGICSSARREK